MNLSQLHQNTQKQLRAALESPAHAYLFYGPKYMYKQRSAEEFVASLVGSNSSLDSNIIKVGGSDGSAIKIADIRSVLLQLSLTPYRDTYRAVVIADAHSMTVDASNALLKALEEPQEGVVFVLVSSRPQQILATIRSRVQQVGFAPAATADGLMPRLRDEIGADAGVRDRYEDLVRETAEFIDGGLTQRFAVAKRVHESKDIGDFVEVLEGVLSSGAAGRPSLYGWLEKVIAVEDQLAHNLNPRLCLENLALEVAA